MEKINERIAWLVDNNGRTKTKTDFAKAINISQPFLSQICSGARIPSDRTISDICREFRVNETWLRTGEGKMRIDSSQRDQLEHFFADVLTTAPDKRSAFVASLDSLPPEFWDMVADWAEVYVANLAEQKEED